MNENSGQHDCHTEGEHVFVPLGQITPSETARVADRVTGTGKRPGSFNSAL